MDRQKIKEQRSRLCAHLNDIVDASLKIEQEMATTPHSKGVAYRSLRPSSGLYVVQTKNSFTVEYLHEGKRYKISVDID